MALTNIGGRLLSRTVAEQMVIHWQGRGQARSMEKKTSAAVPTPREHSGPYRSLAQRSLPLTSTAVPTAHEHS
eukprot:3287562-Lingulodinium_polyedra.AAC.1